MNLRNAFLAPGTAASAALAAALLTSAAAYADDDQLLDITGLRGPIGLPTNVVNDPVFPLFSYHQEDDAYQVVNNSNTVIGSFTDTHSTFETPYFGSTLPPLFFENNEDVVSNSTYSGLADGATESNSQLVTFAGIPGIDFGTLVLFGNDYVNNPGIATSDTLTLFNAPIPLWDIPADAAGGAALDSGGLTDLAGLF